MAKTISIVCAAVLVLLVGPAEARQVQRKTSSTYALGDAKTLLEKFAACGGREAQSCVAPLLSSTLTPLEKGRYAAFAASGPLMTQLRYCDADATAHSYARELMENGAVFCFTVKLPGMNLRGKDAELYIEMDAEKQLKIRKIFY